MARKREKIEKKNLQPPEVIDQQIDTALRAIQQAYKEVRQIAATVIESIGSSDEMLGLIGLTRDLAERALRRAREAKACVTKKKGQMAEKVTNMEGEMKEYAAFAAEMAEQIIALTRKELATQVI